MFACASGLVFSAADTAVAEAWDYLNRPRARDDSVGLTDGELRALRVLRANKAEVEQWVIAAMRKGGGNRELEGTAALIFNKTEILRIARAVVSTYEVGDKDMPFIGFLIFFGEKQDMKLLKELVALDPDSEGAEQQIGMMDQSNNPNAHAALFELKDEVPGKWQESYYSKRFFARQSITPSAAAKADLPEKREAAPPPEARPKTAKKVATHVDESSRRDAAREWGLLGAVLTVAVVAVIVLLGLRARQRRRHDSKPNKA
jgi:hypothetical protein